MSQPNPVSVVNGRPVLNNEQQTEPAQPAWERNLKRALALVVAGCASLVPVLSPETDAGIFAIKACSVIIGFGAALGITSSGNPPKK